MCFKMNFHGTRQNDIYILRNRYLLYVWSIFLGIIVYFFIRYYIVFSAIVLLYISQNTMGMIFLCWWKKISIDSFHFLQSDSAKELSLSHLPGSISAMLGQKTLWTKQNWRRAVTTTTVNNSTLTCNNRTAVFSQCATDISIQSNGSLQREIRVAIEISMEISSNHFIIDTDITDLHFKIYDGFMLRNVFVRRHFTDSNLSLWLFQLLKRHFHFD